MKQLIFKITAVCFAFSMLAFTALSAQAADNDETEDTSVLNLNDEAEIEIGKTIKFTLNLSETTEPIMGFEMRLFYDSDKLEYQPSVTFEKFDVVYFNEDIPGKIPMNWTSLNNLPEFSEKSPFLSAEFKVTNGGYAEISYFITELYGEDMQYLKNYRFTYDVEVDGEKVIEDSMLPVSYDENTLQNNQGDFINYIDGMGEYNTPNVNNHVAVIGNKKVYEESIVENTKVVEVDGKKTSGFPKSLIIVLIAVPVVVVLVVVAVVIVNKKGKNEENGENSAQIDQ